jgi:hypothetical protein
MRELTMIYCGEDGEAGKALANSIRKESELNKVMLGDAGSFDGPETDVVRVIIMPDVPEWRAQKIRDAYPGNVVSKKPLIVDTNDHSKFGSASLLVEGTTDFVEPKKRGWPKGKPRKKAAA